MPDFWMHGTIKEYKVDLVERMATAKIFSKWYFQDPKFADKVRDGDRRLEGVEQEAAYEQLMKGETLYCTMKGECAANEHPSEVFPVNVNQIFVNQRGESKVSQSLCWLAWTERSGTVSIQFVFDVAIHFSPNLARFPYDKHVVPFELATRSWKSKDSKHRWTLCGEEPDWAKGLANRYKEDNFVVTLDGTMSADHPEFHFDEPCVYVFEKGEKTQKPRFCLHIQRKPKFFALRVTIPVFIVVCIALLCFTVRGGSFEFEFGTTLTSLLTMTAFAQTIQGKLPTLPYMTLGDYYFVFGYVYHLIICLKTVITSHLCDERGWHVCEEVDPVTISLIAVWILIHLVLWIDAFLPRDYRPSSRMLPSYERLARLLTKHPLGTMNGKFKHLPAEEPPRPVDRGRRRTAATE